MHTECLTISKCTLQHALEDMQQQNATSASKLPGVMSEAVQAALLQAKQAGLLDAAAPSQSPGQVESLSNDAQYQLRLLISEGLGEAVQHMMHAQVSSIPAESCVVSCLAQARTSLPQSCPARSA